jgi:polyisoprenoid-binding protein YceI
MSKLYLLLFFVLSLQATEIKEADLNIHSGKIIFTSEAKEETLKGIGKQISGNISMKDKTFSVVIDLTDWKTNNRLQTIHMHENYLESEKFPQAIYKGTFVYNSSTGEAELTGVMKIHGVEKSNFTTKGKMISKSGEYNYSTDFIIKLKDFQIDIPKLLVLKLSEEIKVSIQAVLKP